MGLTSILFGVGLLTNTCVQDIHKPNVYNNSQQPSLQLSCNDDLSLRVEKSVGHGSFTLMSNNRLGFVSVGDEVSLSYYWPEEYGVDASLSITDKGFAANIERTNRRGRTVSDTFMSSRGERTHNNLSRVAQLVNEVYLQTINDYFFQEDSSKQAYDVVEDILDKANPYVRGTRPLLFALPAARSYEKKLEEITR